jgi:hypothetical protein
VVVTIVRQDMAVCLCFATKDIHGVCCPFFRSQSHAAALA